MKGIRISTEDKLFSEFVRRRAIRLAGGCERCLTPKFDIVKDDGSIYPAWRQLQACHFIGRRNRAVRFDEDNLVGLCFFCHQHFHENPLEMTKFFKAKLGKEKFEQLRLRAEGVKKVDMAAVKLYLNQLLKRELAGG